MSVAWPTLNVRSRNEPLQLAASAVYLARALASLVAATRLAPAVATRAFKIPFGKDPAFAHKILPH